MWESVTKWFWFHFFILDDKEANFMYRTFDTRAKTALLTIILITGFTKPRSLGAVLKCFIKAGVVIRSVK